MRNEEIALWILTHGGSVSQVSWCNDDERGEGWQWDWDDNEWVEPGDWNSLPSIPSDMIEHFNRKYPKGI